MPKEPVTRGAYGFRLAYQDWGDAFADLHNVDDSAPEVTLGWRHACAATTHKNCDGERASMGTKGGAGFFVTRDPPSVIFDLPTPVPPEALIHPMGTVPLSVLARWRGDITLHAGAFATAAGAWMLAGDRAAGKSSMLGLLAVRGIPLVADDLVAILDGYVWPGPSCIDLRPEAAEHIGGGRDLGTIGLRPRIRLSASSVATRTPLRGMFLLTWDDCPEIEIDPIHLGERVELLLSLDYSGLPDEGDPRSLLDVATLPAWRIRRPRGWGIANETADRILELTSAPVPEEAGGQGR